MDETPPPATPNQPPQKQVAAKLPVISPDWRRPNQERAIEVFGVFNDQMGEHLLSRVASLRSQSNAAITVYINSVGGSVQVLKYINGLLDSRDLDSNFCRTVSVALGTAASAGAILLAYGDYAYAYEHSIIHFHGIRTAELPDDFENAAEVIGSLNRTQAEVARRLAMVTVRRVAFRYQRLKDSFNTKRSAKSAGSSDKHLIKLKCFIDSISGNVSPKAQALVHRTYESVVKAKTLTQKIVPKATKSGSRTSARSDAKVLIELIKHEILEYEKKKKGWKIDEHGAVQIVNDYFILRDYVFGEHNQAMGALLENLGRDFLSTSQLTKYNQIKTSNNEKAFEFLAKIALPILEPLWFYTVSLCRTLFAGENRLTPADAYWLGIIDEVIGTDLVGLRVVAEMAAKKKAAAEAAAPPPTSKSPHSAGIASG